MRMRVMPMFRLTFAQLTVPKLAPVQSGLHDGKAQAGILAELSLRRYAVSDAVPHVAYLVHHRTLKVVAVPARHHNLKVQARDSDGQNRRERDPDGPVGRKAFEHGQRILLAHILQISPLLPAHRDRSLPQLLGELVPDVPRKPEAPDEEGEQPEGVACPFSITCTPEACLHRVETAAESGVEIPAHSRRVDPDVEQERASHNLKCRSLTVLVEIALPVGETKVFREHEKGHGGSGYAGRPGFTRRVIAHAWGIGTLQRSYPNLC
eukprot:scaffold9114_cov118-Isochrysis_galbana.AAC.9